MVFTNDGDWIILSSGYCFFMSDHKGRLFWLNRSSVLERA